LLLRADASGTWSVRVRWSAASDNASLAPFDSYLAERVGLLLHTPEGA
jgi:hypothetical protein